MKNIGVVRNHLSLCVYNSLLSQAKQDALSLQGDIKYLLAVVETLQLVQ